MNVVTLHQPPLVVFGNGCAVQCAEWVERLGVRRLLLVSTRTVFNEIGSLVHRLRATGCALLQAPPIPPEPTCTIFKQTLSHAQAEKVEAVMAIGGGSALDVGKLVAALVSGNQSIEEVFGVGLLKGRSLPLACLPTTAGTGSEVS